MVFVPALLKRSIWKYIGSVLANCAFDVQVISSAVTVRVGLPPASGLIFVNALTYSVNANPLLAPPIPWSSGANADKAK